jgi:hypothetical protein
MHGTRVHPRQRLSIKALPLLSQHTCSCAGWSPAASSPATASEATGVKNAELSDGAVKEESTLRIPACRRYAVLSVSC